MNERKDLFDDRVPSIGYDVIRFEAGSSQALQTSWEEKVIYSDLHSI